MFGAHECQSIPETSNRSLSRTEPFYEAYSSRELKFPAWKPHSRRFMQNREEEDENEEEDVRLSKCARNSTRTRLFSLNEPVWKSGNEADYRDSALVSGLGGVLTRGH